MNNFASLLILGYKRPDMLEQCLTSLHQTRDYPAEVILNMDSANNDRESQMIAEEYFHKGKISKLILSGGNNRGVGRSLQNCIGVAEGEYIFKIDTDLLFKPHWLSTSVKILENNPDISTLSLFNYRNYDPDDARFSILRERKDCFIVNDFVSSIFGFTIDRLNFIQKDIPSDGLHQQLHGHLAITKEDYVINQGFGLGKSVWVVPDEKGNPVATKIYDKPLIFGEK